MLEFVFNFFSYYLFKFYILKYIYVITNKLSNAVVFKDS